MSSAMVRGGFALPLGSREVERVRRDDGTELLRNREALEPYLLRATDPLERWARERPNRTFLAERDEVREGFREMTYAQTFDAVRSIAQALLERGLDRERGIAILSGNSIDHALVALAAQYAGVPYAPISPTYSLSSKDFGKLREIVGNFEPGVVFVDDGSLFGDAIEAAVPRNVEVVVATARGGHPFTTELAELRSTAAADALERAHAAVEAETIAKVLFTSGTTGAPKGVTCSHRMLCSNAQMFAQVFPFVREEPPVLVDWLPWNHTFGGNHNFGLVLFAGGTLVINDGKPTPALAARTIRNLHAIAPTIYFDVPKGFEIVARALRDDDALRRHFFSRLRMLFYAGAGLSKPVWDELRALSRETLGGDCLISTSLGSTETGPMALATPWLADEPGNVGVPVPGVELKLVPHGAKREARLRGPNITRGYWRAPHLTREAFDDEGFYRIGDALRYVDPERPREGLVFDGRFSEDFKLATGTWVSAGPLRAALLARLSPVVWDLVVSGLNRNEIAILAFPDIARARALASDVPDDAPLAALFASEALRAWLRRVLAEHATTAGSATRVERVVLLEHPPSLDAGEVTDKGSLYSRAILERRRALVDDAHHPHPPPHVIVLEISA